MKKRDVNSRKLSVPFAKTGIKTPIPLATQPDGKVSYEKGYTDLYQKAKKAGGLQLLLGNHNQILNDITSDTIANSDDLLALEGEVEGIINKLDNSTPKLLTENLEWSVGSGVESDTHFNDLQSAIEKASMYISTKYTITIKLIENLSISAPININNLFLPFLNIDFNEFELKYTGNPVLNQLLRFDNCTLNSIIKLKLNCNNIDNLEGIGLNRTNLQLYDKVEIYNCLGIASINVFQQSQLIIYNCKESIISGNTGFKSSGVSNILIAFSDITQNSGALSKEVRDCSKIACASSIFKGSTTSNSQVENIWTKDGIITI